MKKKKQINILDVTLREGNYIINFGLKNSQISQIVDYLDGAKISHIEVSNIGGSYPTGLTDSDYIQAGRESIKQSKLGALLALNYNPQPNFNEIVDQLDFIRVGVDIFEVERAFHWVDQLKKRGVFTFVQLMRTPFISPSKAAVAAKKAEKMGADVVYIVDTTGSLTPPLVKEYVKAVRNKVNIPIGFHGHNNLSLAVANSLEAVKNGCEWVDASLLGVGRQAGNAQLEILALLLEREGYKIPLDIPLILDISESLIAPVFKNYKGIDPYDLWAAYWNLDLNPSSIYQKLASTVGLGTKSFIRELAKIKQFYSLDMDGKLLTISKKFNVPIELILECLKTN